MNNDQDERICERSPFDAVHSSFFNGFSEQKCVETFNKADFFNIDDIFPTFLFV